MQKHRQKHWLSTIQPAEESKYIECKQPYNKAREVRMDVAEAVSK